jgi:hypothetical protein
MDTSIDREAQGIWTHRHVGWKGIEDRCLSPHADVLMCSVYMLYRVVKCVVVRWCWGRQSTSRHRQDTQHSSTTH